MSSPEAHLDTLDPPLAVDFNNCVICQGHRLIICTDHIPMLRVVPAAHKDGDDDSVKTPDTYALPPGGGRQPGKLRLDKPRRFCNSLTKAGIPN